MSNPSSTTRDPRPGLSFVGMIVTRCEVVLAALFLWAAFNKLRPPNGPDLFSDSIKAFKLNLPDWLTRFSVGTVPWVELLAGIALILGFWSRAAATVFALLLVVFLVLIIQALARGLNVECGCFGKLSPFCPPTIGTCNIIQNSILLLIALIIALTPRHKLAA